AALRTEEVAENRRKEESARADAIREQETGERKAEQERRIAENEKRLAEKKIQDEAAKAAAELRVLEFQSRRDAAEKKRAAEGASRALQEKEELERQRMAEAR